MAGRCSAGNSRGLLPEFCDAGLSGANVTVPNKEVAAAACDWLDDAARSMGAANTIWLDDSGRLCGPIRMVSAFSAILISSPPVGRFNVNLPWSWGQRSRTCCCVGIALAEIHKSAYRQPDIRKSKSHCGYVCSGTIAHEWDNLGTVLEEADLLVNTTSLGMAGKAPLEIDLSPLPKTAIVTDAVYAPLETDLLRSAKGAGNRTVDGLGMLLHQAVPAFERWFGVRPEVDDTLRNLILEDLGVTA